MPSLNDLQLFLSVLLPLVTLCLAVPLDSANEDLPEISGEEIQFSTGSSVQNKCHSFAKLLHEDIKRLRDEQFQRDFGEAVINMTNYETVRIKILHSNPSDVCLRRNFDEDRCLKRIYTGLRTYREYLTYVERENLTASLILSVKQSTTRLLNIIKDKLKDGQNQAPHLSALHDASAWTRKTVTHSVLYEFEVFMTETSRAIKFMSKNQVTSRNGNIRLPAKLLHK